MDEPAGSRSVALPVRRPFACARPAELYGGDDDPFGVLALHDLDVPTAERLLGLPRAAAAAAVRAGQQASFARLFPLIRAAPKLLAPLQHVYRRTYVRGEAPLRIVDVRPVEPVFAAQPFALAVRCQSLGPDRIVLVSVEVGWAGEPFVVERSVEPDDPADGVVHVVFGDEQALPVGPTDFTVSVWRADGTQATFHRTIYVLPADALSLVLGRPHSTVTSSAYRPEADGFVVDCRMTLANGTARAQQFERGIRWLLSADGDDVDSGVHRWSSPIVVPAFGVWEGVIRIESPRGSPAFARYERWDDLPLVVSMLPAGLDPDTATALVDVPLRAATVTRMMQTFGINLIRVGELDPTEEADMISVLDTLKGIFEGNSINLDPVECRQIGAQDVSGFDNVGTFDEFGDLLESWSCPNNFVDMYLVREMWDGNNGYAGAINGPAAKGGRKDGVVVMVMGSGTAPNRKLKPTTQPRLMAHEVGHYFGLEHVFVPNLMWDSVSAYRTAHLEPSQRQTIELHGYVLP